MAINFYSGDVFSMLFWNRCMLFRSCYRWRPYYEACWSSRHNRNWWFTFIPTITRL